MDVKMAFKVHEVLFDEINDAKDFKLTRKIGQSDTFVYYLLFHLVANTINQIKYMNVSADSVKTAVFPTVFSFEMTLKIFRHRIMIHRKM